MDRKAHWDGVYASKSDTEVSWYQARPALSLTLIGEICPHKGRVIDVGGGASVLVDRLLDAGFDQPAVLDVSETALARAKARLGQASRRVQWIVADVTKARDIGRFDVWHDRAVFHFLAAPQERRAYVELATRTLSPGGHVVLSTFALDGPMRCSGLDVCRYDAASVSAELDQAFELVKESAETHITPAGQPQSFFYGVFRRV